jgi:hypothetical protein
MTYTNLDSLIKIRTQIAFAEKYRVENPDWQSPVEILKILRDRESFLMGQIERERKMQHDGCTNHGCWIDPPKGMATNGPCHCLDPLGSKKARIIIRKLTRLRFLEKEPESENVMTPDLPDDVYFPLKVKENTMDNVEEPYQPEPVKIKRPIKTDLRMLAINMKDMAEELKRRGWTEKAYEMAGAANLVVEWSDNIVSEASDACRNVAKEKSISWG